MTGSMSGKTVLITGRMWLVSADLVGLPVEARH